MSKTLKVAVIGAGAIGQRRHLPEYAAREDCEIVAVVDKKVSRAREVARQFGAPVALKDYKDILKMDLDAVSVCTPNAWHCEQTVACLKAKMHVLCEKPMALSLPEARKMIRAAKDSHRNLMIGHNQRFTASHVKGKEIIRSGQLGRITGFDTVFTHQGPEGWSVDGLKCQFFKKNQAGLGSLADLGVHKLDLMRWLLDDEIVEVAAMTDTLVKAKCTVEDTAYAVCRMAGGCLGQMYASWTHPTLCDNSTIVYGTKGVLRLEDDPVYPLIATFTNGDEYYMKLQAIQTNEEGGQTFSGVIDSFVDAIQARRKPIVPGEEGAQSLAAVLACVESAKTRRFVRVKKV